MSEKYAIQIENLKKTFGNGWGKKFTAVSDLNISIKENEVFGYLGANGAGKTTTFKLMLSLIYPDRGTIRFWGENIDDNRVKIRDRIGYLPESPYFYMYLTARESLSFYASLYGMKSRLKKDRIASLVELVGLDHAKDIPIKKFSRGMLQRLGIAQALINDPDLLILDEPMSGLDPIGRKDMRNIILRCRDEGKTIIFSSHIISDVETICDRASILKRGELKAIVEIDDMLDQETKEWELVYKGAQIRWADQMKNKISVDKEIGENVFFVKTDQKDIAFEMMHTVSQQHNELISFTPVRRSLEEMYLRENR